MELLLFVLMVLLRVVRGVTELLWRLQGCGLLLRLLDERLYRRTRVSSPPHVKHLLPSRTLRSSADMASHWRVTSAIRSAAPKLAAAGDLRASMAYSKNGDNGRLAPLLFCSAIAQDQIPSAHG